MEDSWRARILQEPRIARITLAADCADHTAGRGFARITLTYPESSARCRAALRAAPRPLAGDPAALIDKTVGAELE
jgi:hypothetical protein